MAQVNRFLRVDIPLGAAALMVAGSLAAGAAVSAVFVANPATPRVAPVSVDANLDAVVRQAQGWELERRAQSGDGNIDAVILQAQEWERQHRDQSGER